MKPQTSVVLAAWLMAMTAAADPSADAKAHSEAFAKAFNAHDVKGVVALYAEDARAVWPGQGEEATGRAEIEKLAINAFKMFPDVKAVLKSQEVIALGKSYIATVGHWEETFTTPDGKLQTAQVRTTEILRKKGTQTLYVVDHASLGVPPPPEPAPAGKKPAEK
jgi:uncharacterized protein (TIGR02246 family)